MPMWTPCHTEALPVQSSSGRHYAWWICNLVYRRCRTCNSQECNAGEGMRHTQQTAGSDALPAEEAERRHVRAQIRHVTGLQRQQILVLTLLLYASSCHVRVLPLTKAFAQHLSTLYQCSCTADLPLHGRKAVI